ncbi:MAG: type II secretion system F family protein [Planctomycetota bacterium]|nr:type II secretion system F family protein [Planctomycetota bacterium]
MTDQPQIMPTFAYQAMTPDGQPISGTIDAATAPLAQQRLEAIQLQAIELDIAPRPPRGRRMGADDFLAFNQQLAQLTGASLPVEQGLRLIADELQSGSVKQTISQVVAELEKGTTLAQALEIHRSKFPPLYSRLIDAGIRGGNLPGILLNLSRHLTLVQRLRAMLWQSLTYPIMVIGVLVGVVLFIVIDLFPNFEIMFRDFHSELPAITQFVLATGRIISDPRFLGTVAFLIVMLLVIGVLFRLSGRLSAVSEFLLLPSPIIGPVLRRSLIARWADAVALGVDGGMDLPAAIDLASDAINSPALRADGRNLVGAISVGQTINSVHGLRVIPGTVLGAMDMAAIRGDLPATMHTLSQIYQEQAELRLASVQGILMPLVLVVVGLIVAVVMFAVLAPIISLIQAISGPMH